MIAPRNDLESPSLDWVPFVIAAAFAALLLFILRRNNGSSITLKPPTRISLERWKNWLPFDD